jgi:hypothetical protein
MRLGRTSELTAAGLITGCALLAALRPVAAEEVPVSVTTLHAPGAVSDMIRGPLLEGGEVRPLSPEAARVALTALSLREDAPGAEAVAALSGRPGASVDLGSAGTLTFSVLDPAAPDTVREMFSPDPRLSDVVVVDPSQPDPTLAVDYAMALVSPGEGDQLDLTVTPRAGLAVGPEGSAAAAGAEVRFGQYLDEGAESPRWYVFAAADRRALLYDPMQGASMDAVALTQREVVGDAQAGVAMRLGDVDVSLALVHREFRHTVGLEDFEEAEQFGTVSVHWNW